MTTLSFERPIRMKVKVVKVVFGSSCSKLQVTPPAAPPHVLYQHHYARYRSAGGWSLTASERVRVCREVHEGGTEGGMQGRQEAPPLYQSRLTLTSLGLDASLCEVMKLRTTLSLCRPPGGDGMRLASEQQPHQSASGAAGRSRT